MPGRREHEGERIEGDSSSLQNRLQKKRKEKLNIQGPYPWRKKLSVVVILSIASRVFIWDLGFTTRNVEEKKKRSKKPSSDRRVDLWKGGTKLVLPKTPVRRENGKTCQQERGQYLKINKGIRRDRGVKQAQGLRLLFRCGGTVLRGPSGRKRGMGGGVNRSLRTGREEERGLELSEKERTHPRRNTAGI